MHASTRALDRCRIIIGMKELQIKYEALISIVRDMERVAVAFSGGVDSALLLAASREALGTEVLALTADTAFFSASETAAATAFCEGCGVPQRIVAFDILAVDEVVENAPDRCYRCKQQILAHLLEAAQQVGAVLVEGSNASDAEAYRPGARALREAGVRSPLAEVGLTKAEVREASRQLGLPTWDKPSMACLATRFPYGTRIVRAGLARVDEAERMLHEAGFDQVRVRVHDEMARIEVMPDQLPRLLDASMRAQVHAALKDVGFSYVTADLLGYRTGSADEVLEGL